MVTPIKVGVLAPYLANYKHASYLIKGFTSGFHLGFSGQRQFRLSPNLSSCHKFSDVISHKIKTEVSAGRLKGPFPVPPFKNIQISPIGCVPKKSPGDFRLIHHLSYPTGSSINDGIMPELASVSYCSFDDAVHTLLKIGRGALMCKTDIESAFRLIPVHPADHELLGYQWQSQFYYDCCLPFGCRSSPAIFERFSTAIEWIAKTHLNISDIIHILDDFFMIGPQASEKCLKDLTSFLTFCKKVGIPIKAEKTVYPTTCITFMGLELDSVEMEARLPPDKLIKARQLLNKYCNKRKIRLKELQSLIGYLSFCCSVVPPGRCFLRRLIDKTKNIRNPAHRVTLNRESRRDLQAWQLFVEHFNGKNLLSVKYWRTTHSWHLYTDAAGTLGYGAIFGKSWFNGSWPEQIAHLPITFKELFPIVLAMEIWGSSLRNQCLIAHSDNLAVVHIINKQTCKESYIMILVRRLVLSCMKFNISLRCVHISGKYNILPDLLSRFQVEEFHRLAPEMEKDPVPIPVCLLEGIF